MFHDGAEESGPVVALGSLAKLVNDEKGASRGVAECEAVDAKRNMSTSLIDEEESRGSRNLLQVDHEG